MIFNLEARVYSQLGNLNKSKYASIKEIVTAVTFEYNSLVGLNKLSQAQGTQTSRDEYGNRKQELEIDYSRYIEP